MYADNVFLPFLYMVKTCVNGSNTAGILHALSFIAPPDIVRSIALVQSIVTIICYCVLVRTPKQAPKCLDSLALHNCCRIGQ